MTLTWDDIFKAEKLLIENKVDGPFYLEVKDPYWVEQWHEYKRKEKRKELYERRYKRNKGKHAS